MNDDSMSFYLDTTFAYVSTFNTLLKYTGDADRAERLTKDWWKGVCKILSDTDDSIEANGFTTFWDGL